MKTTNKELINNIKCIKKMLIDKNIKIKELAKLLNIHISTFYLAISGHRDSIRYQVLIDNTLSYVKNLT